MKLQSLIANLFLILMVSCAANSNTVYQSGQASWYGKKFHGKKTASGEDFNMNSFTAAHRKLDFGTKLKVVDPETKRSVIVRINDRGPHVKGRIIDLSKAAAKKIGLIKKGSAKVKLYLLSD